jgi:hypothetical protein
MIPLHIVGSGKRHVRSADPLIADHRNFYKVEKWTKDGSKVDRNLDKTREVFAVAISHRPQIRLTIRQQNACFGNGQRSRLARDDNSEQESARCLRGSN